MVLILGSQDTGIKGKERRDGSQIIDYGWGKGLNYEKSGTKARVSREDLSMS